MDAQSAVARLNENLANLKNEPDSPVKRAKIKKVEGWLLEMQTALAINDVAPETQLKMIQAMTSRLQALIGTEWWVESGADDGP